MGMKPSPPQIIRDAEHVKYALAGENGTTGASLKRQELCRLLSTLLLSDLDFALDKKAEQDLWNFAFHLPIQSFQNKAREQKGNSVIQSQLTNLLESASGFYLQLLQSLCWQYGLELGPNGRYSWVQGAAPQRPPQTSLLYICQHCLVHLGDLARYRGQSLQAETFYRRALDLSPNNGQPYNQLALLEAASGEKLSSVFYYMRSLAVQFPFPNAATNLQKLFSNILSDGFGGDLKTKHTAFEYIQSFLHVHARLHLSSSGEVGKLERMLGELSLSLPALVIAERLDSWQLVEMAALGLFAWDHQQSPAVLELLAGLLTACLHAALGPRDSARLGPPIKVVLDWLLLHPALIFREQFLRRPQIWQGLCKLLNSLLLLPPAAAAAAIDVSTPLPEDWELRCFLPLAKAHTSLDFTSDDSQPTEEEFHQLRASRLLRIGRALSQLEGRRIISLGEDGTFSPVPCDPHISDPTPVRGPEPPTKEQEVRFQLEENPPRAEPPRFVESRAEPPRFVESRAEPPRFVENRAEPPRIPPASKAPPPPAFGAGRSEGRKNVAMQAILQQRAASSNLQVVEPSPAPEAIRPQPPAPTRMRLPPENYFPQNTSGGLFPDTTQVQQSRLPDRYQPLQAMAAPNNGTTEPLPWGGPQTPANNPHFQQSQNSRYLQVFSQAPPPNKLCVQPPKPPQLYGPVWNYMIPAAPANYFMLDNYGFPPQPYRPDPPAAAAATAKQAWGLEDSQLRGFNTKPPASANNPAADSNTYSLFSNSPWPSLPPRKDSDLKNGMTAAAPGVQQSLFSGPGPSALERLLEQQKLQHRDTGT